MHHLLSAVLLVTSTTTPKKSTTPSALLWTLFAVEFAVGLGLAEVRRWLRGSYPWRLPSLAWGLFVVITQGLAVLLLALAWFTTKPKPGDTPGRAGPGGGRPTFRELMTWRRAQRYSGRQRYAGGMATGTPPTGVVPGTYGTSLPPHLEDRDGVGEPTPVGEPAGWRRDPTGRHEYRYWNGNSWSRHVADQGRRSVDVM